jgi:hypothetical protein
MQALHEAAQNVHPIGLDAALDVLLDRLIHSRPEDCDGVAHVAITAGSLVEGGASARRLAEVLLAKVPEVLRSARRYADLCLRDLPEPGEDTEEDEEDGFTVVDGRTISHEVFRAHLAADRAGGCSVAYLRLWVLPTVAALTRDREMLLSAVTDPQVVGAAAAMADSDASWLDMLLGVEQDQAWIVLCPPQGRGFRVVLDGIVDNFTLHALLAAALVPLGIPGQANAPEVIAFLRGESESCPVDHITGSWNLYDYRAAGLKLTRPMEVPQSTWVWGEGRPRDVPRFEGIRTLVIGPAAYQRSWSAGRTFAALPADIRVSEELPAAQVRSLIARAAEAASREPAND